MQKNYQNKMMVTNNKGAKNEQEFFFPDIDGQSITVKAANMKEAEGKARKKIKGSNKDDNN